MEQVDRQDVPITWGGCNCDLDAPCNHPPCVMEQDVAARHHRVLFDAGALSPPVGTVDRRYAEDMVGAGRAHLLTIDESGDEDGRVAPKKKGTKS